MFPVLVCVLSEVIFSTSSTGDLYETDFCISENN